jgi:hypothetical protein
MGGKTAGAVRAPRAGVDHPACGLEALDREEHLRPPGIDEPQCPYSRGVVGSRQALRVFPHGGIADDLDDQVGPPFEFHESVGPAFCCRHQADAAGSERGFRYRHDVGFDREVRRDRRHPRLPREQVRVASLRERPQNTNQFRLERPVREDVFRRHVDLDAGSDPVDARTVGKLRRLSPPPKPIERPDGAGDFALVGDEHGGHGEFARKGGGERPRRLE